jgi:hypothetical protein
MRPRLARLLAVGLLVIAAIMWARALGYAQTGPASLSSGGFCGYSGAATPLSTQITSGAAYASASITNGTVHVPVLPVLSQGALIGAIVTVGANTIRERHDGTSPTTDIGVLYGTGTAANASETANGQSFIVCGTDLAKLRLTGSSVGPATVHFNYYGPGR